MRHLNEAVWSRKFINDLPDSSFLLILPGGTKEAGKTTPRDLRKFPVKNERGQIDRPHLRNALARIPQARITASEKATALRKARRLARRTDIEVAPESTENAMATPNTIREMMEWAGTSMKVDRETGIIRDVPLLGPTSRNRRRYSEAAMRGAVAKFEGTQVYANHPDPEAWGRDIRDLAGHVQNVRFEGGKVRGDVHVLEHHREWAMPVAEADRAGAGMSWIGEADHKIADDGWADVEAIRNVLSVDIVASPATVSNFSESEGTDEEDDMSDKWQELLADAQEQLTETKLALVTVTDERDKLKAESADTATKLAEYERKEGFAKLVAEVGIDPKAIGADLAEAISALDETKARKALEDLKKTAESKTAGGETTTSDTAEGSTVPNGDTTGAWTSESILADVMA